MRQFFTLSTLSILILLGCNPSKEEYKCNTNAQKLSGEYAPFALTTNTSHLSDNQKELLPILFEVADIMDELYWKQAWGDKEDLLSRITDDHLREITLINYGPWNRLDGQKSFIVNIPKKSLGAELYPKDMHKEEFDQFLSPIKTSNFSLIKRDSLGALKAIPYHIAYKASLQKASTLLLKAASLAEDSKFKAYLTKRAKSLITDEYYESDIAWMDIADSKIDFVVGPIENYEDQLYGYKTSYEGIVLIKDERQSEQLDQLISILPELQKTLPVAEAYKSEVPSLHSKLGIYDMIYSQGDGNAAGKTIAINLPNDAKIRNTKGSRQMLLRNAMRAKFDKIVIPITREVIVKEQQQYVNFDAFLQNTIFIHLANSLGMRQTLDGDKTVAESLKEHYTTIESCKADILSLYLLSNTQELGEDHDIKNNYVTIMADIFRSLRFGEASNSGKANMIRFNYFCQYGAFEKDMITGKYQVNFEKMNEAMKNLATKLLTIEGDGDYQKASELIEDLAIVPADLKADLVKIRNAGIPRDIVFEQGIDQLEL
ncbi:Zn-dependent hydrolase [Halosquirtibacter xylanolyticus]|uniref:dipeptidyl-peptidase 3 family protein n=1 Tax=Halosquirtibacter xylanolyticus TaxID=3374599 RepID=UPI003748C184|nr:Zn-dependent hydrolase [Prolixibacteraceae bacterium]